MSNNLNYEISDGNSILADIFMNNSKDIKNPLLPFALHIKGDILICTERCGQKFTNTDIKTSLMKNYGKILMLKPSNNNSELTVFSDSRNDDADEDGNGKYKLKYICFTCPSTIKIGNDDSDMQSYLIYSNDKGLYNVICTLYNNSSAVDPLPNALLGSLLSSNNIPNLGGSNGNISLKNIDITHFFPQNSKEYYQFINSDSNHNKQNVLVNVFKKKVNISSNIIENLKQKLFDARSNHTFSSYKNNLDNLMQIKPSKINIFYIPDIKLSYSNTNETMKNYENNKKPNIDEEFEEEEEEIPLITKLKRSKLENNKEVFINFTDDLKIYKIDIHDGSKKKIFNNPNPKKTELVDYITYKDLFVQYKNYDKDEIDRAIKEFPNYTYQNSCWRTDYKLRLYTITDKDNEEVFKEDSFTITEYNSIDDVKKKIDPKLEDKDIFYCLKNFPNYGINDKYYISYYYPESSDTNQYVLIMYIFLCWFILLTNYIFYRLIYFSINKDYGDISINDDEIRGEDNYKQLASIRLVINIIFVIQIIAAFIYSIISLSGLIEIDEKNNHFYSIYPFLVFLYIVFTLYYAYIRLFFNDKRVSYAESKSLKLFLDSNSNNENSFMGFFKNVGELILNYFFIMPSNTENDYGKLKSLIDKLDLSNGSNNVAEFLVESDHILEQLEKNMKENGNENNNTKSRFDKLIQSILSKFEDIKSETTNKLSNVFPEITKSETKQVKDKAKELIKKAESLLSSSKSQSGGVNTPAVIPEINQEFHPIITAQQSNGRNLNNNNEFNSVINGKPYFPNSNNLSNEESEELTKSDWYNNLLEAITKRNLFMFIIFTIVYTYILNLIKSIIKTFDISDNGFFVNAGSNISMISSLYYLILVTIFTIIYFYRNIYEYYFVAKKTIDNSEKTGERGKYLTLFIGVSIYLLMTWYIFTYVDDDYGKAFYYIVELIGLGFIGYKIYQTGDYYNWKIYILPLIYIIFFIVGGSVNKTISYRITLTATLILIALFASNILGNYKNNLNINVPITLPDSNNNFSYINNNSSVSNTSSSTENPPSYIPSVGGLQEIAKLLNEMKNTGGNIKNKKVKLTESVNSLNFFKEHFKNDQSKIKMIEDIISQIEDIRDLK